MFDRCLNYLRRNEVVQALHCQLREHPGTPSVLPIEALLLGMMLALIVYKTYLRADAHKMLVGLSAYQACQVGLCNPETGWLPFSYEMVQEQIKNIEAALHEGWDESLSLPWNIPNPDEPMHPSWIDKTSKTSNWGMLRFAVVMLRHSIPRAARRAATHGALDSTTISTSARLLDARKEKVAQAELAANPPPAVPVGQLPPIGTNGPYGRIRRTKCPDALPAYKGGTPSESSGMNSGFDGHMLTLTRDGIWTGHAKHYAEGDPVPNYVPMVIVKPGLVEYLDTGIDLLDLALLVVPNLRHVSADQGYTQAHRFKDALLEMGIDLAFAMDARTAARCIAIHAGKKHGGEQLLMNSSAIFPPWLPKDMHAPPKNLTSTELQEWLDNPLPTVTAYVCVNRYPNGAIRVMCPQCAGKISTSLKTRRSTTPRHKMNAALPCISTAPTSIAVAGFAQFTRISCPSISTSRTAPPHGAPCTTTASPPKGQTHVSRTAMPSNAAGAEPSEIRRNCRRHHSPHRHTQLANRQQEKPSRAPHRTPHRTSRHSRATARRHCWRPRPTRVDHP